MMKRRTKLKKSLLHSHSQQTLNKLMAIEAIITSHINSIPVPILAASDLIHALTLIIATFGFYSYFFW